LLTKIFPILGIGKLVTTEYRVLPSSWYSAEPSSALKYLYSATFLEALPTRVNVFNAEEGDFQVLADYWSNDK